MDLGTEAARLSALALFLVALHDIGKASAEFQAKVEDLWPWELAGSAWRRMPACNHGELTGWYLLKGPLKPVLERLLPAPAWTVPDRLALIEAVAGHHGRPAHCMEAARSDSVGEPFKRAATDIVAAIETLLAPSPLVGEPDLKALNRFAWLLACLTPMADWLGSNPEWFRPARPELSLAEYWERRALPQAAKAIKESGLQEAAVAPVDRKRLFPGITIPSPLQRWACEVTLPEDGRALALIEDATGSGKTEAAILLAHRLMAAGHADGFYLALPTMATANAMYDRLEQSYRRLFVEGSNPSLNLIHGRSKGSDRLRKLETASADPDSVAAFCAGWIADDRRKAFVAQAGAGTIDQAILSVLPAKYQTLRLYGLSRKVLIIDEAHAYDSFMAREVEALLSFHAMLGAPAIVLSATLPMATRQALLAAYAKGGGWPSPPEPQKRAYPMASFLTGAGLLEEGLGMREGSDRSIRVERVASVDTGEAMALDMARKGAAVAVVRSTVDAAIETFQRLRATIGEAVAVQLFHARLLPRDRDRIEHDVVSRFGKDAEPEYRRSRILVATQVVEMSLDLDFDSIISDLAPVDLLIQRAGRLWRHARWNVCRPLPEPVLHVISPDPPADAGPQWLVDTPEPQWIYENTALLWKSAKAIFEAGRIVTMDYSGDLYNAGHVRELVEGVYDLDERELPAGLREAWERAEGRDMGDRQAAGYNCLDPRKGYSRGTQNWPDDAVVATRLDGGSRPVRLALVEGAKLVPMPGAKDWSLSEIRLGRRMQQGLAAPDSQQLSRLAPPWREADRETLLLALRRDGDMVVGDKDQSFTYTSHVGLVRSSQHGDEP